MRHHPWAWLRMRARGLWVRWKWRRLRYQIVERIGVLEVEMEGLRAEVKGLQLAIVFMHYAGNPDRLRGYVRSIRERQERRR